MFLLILLCLIVSFLNLFFTLFLSNSFFRFVTSLKSPESSLTLSRQRNPQISQTSQTSDSGLVDLKPSLTYDLRFRNEQ